MCTFQTYQSKVALARSITVIDFFASSRCLVEWIMTRGVCFKHYVCTKIYRCTIIYDVCSYNTQRLQRKNPLWGDDDESVAVSSFIIEIKPRKLPFNFPGCSLLSNSLNWLIINYVPLKTWHKHHKDRLFNHYNYITFFPLAPNPNPLL